MMKTTCKHLIIAFLLFAFVGNTAAQTQQTLRKSAFALYEKGKYDDAIVGFLKLLEINSKDAQAEWYCASAYSKIGFYSEAIRHYQHIAENTNMALSYANLGGVLAQMGYYDQSMQMLNKAIELDPDYIYSYANRGVVNAYWYKIEDALEDYEFVAQEEDELSTAMIVNKAIVHQAIGNFDESERLMKLYFEQEDAEPEYVLFLEEIRMERDQKYKPLKHEIEKAETIYTAEIKKNRYYYNNYFERGKCYLLLGKKELAQKDFQQCLLLVNDILEDMPDAWRFNRVRGILYKHLGEKDKARKEFEYVLSINPKERSVQQLLGELNQK